MKDKKGAEDMICMLGLIDPVDELVMTDDVCCVGMCVLKREDANVLRKAIEFEAEGEMRNGRLKSTCTRQLEEECIKDGLCVGHAILLVSMVGWH